MRGDVFFMDLFACSMLACSFPICMQGHKLTERHRHLLWGSHVSQKCYIYCAYKFCPLQAYVVNLGEIKNPESKEEKARFRWTEIGPDITEDQKQAIYQLPLKMSKRCKALMKQIICFSANKASLSDLLAGWVRIMKPRRADWLVVLRELKHMNHPLHLEVAEIALLEESFEANVRDYTKIIDIYGKQNRLKDAENTLTAMQTRGLLCDQVILTTMVHLYSKSGNLKMAEEAFEEMTLLGKPLDRRSYGSMVMAYIRAGMLDQGEMLLQEMEAQEIYAGPEVYKALLRAHSMAGNSEGAQKVFDTIQLAQIPPDPKLCALLINAYKVAGQSQEARVAFENMRKAGLEPNDKCVSLMLGVYEQENRLNAALDFLMDLEGGGVMVGQEASAILAGWFRRLNVVEDVELVLREYAATGTHQLSAS